MANNERTPNIWKKYLEAAGFLQNLMYINIGQTDDEKILRYNTLSTLYNLIHMQRKAGFFKRIAAMQCVSPNNPKPGWTQCYYLLLQALGAYDISLDPKYKEHNKYSGWPAVQLRVLHELIYSARKMGNPAIAIRHITYLMHVMFDHLTESERTELVRILQTYTPHCEGSAVTLALENGMMLPPVAFHRFPSVSIFKPESPAEKSKAFAIKKAASLKAVHGSPFIYSPLMQARKNSTHPSKIDFVWQENEECLVTIEAFNPLPIDLEVKNMVLLTEGVACDHEPQDFTLIGQSSQHVLLKTTPTESGTLKILGYQTLVLGCRSNCRFRDMTSRFDLDQFDIKVVPRLPHLEPSLTTEQYGLLDNIETDEDNVTQAQLSLYTGQSCELCIRLQNTSDIPIEYIDIVSHTEHSQSDLFSHVVTWQLANLRAQLPIRPHTGAVLTLYLTGALPVNQIKQQTLESSLSISYSGGAALEEDYCHHCDISLSVTVIPAALVTSVQVLPAFCAEQCSLCLSVQNSSQHGLRVWHTDSSTAHEISSQENSRLTFPMPRCKTSLHDQVMSRNNQTVSASSNRVSSGSSHLQILSNQIQEHLRNVLDIRWSLIGHKVEGAIDLSDWSWNEEAMLKMCNSPVSLSVTIQDQHYAEPDDVITANIDSPVSFSLKLTNTSDCDIGWLSLGLNTADEELSAPAFVVLGSSSVTADHLCVGHSILLETDIQFLCAGLHEITLNCHLKVNTRSNYDLISSKDNKVKVKVESEQKTEGQGDVKKQSIDINNLTTIFLPSVSIMVTNENESGDEF